MKRKNIKRVHRFEEKRTIISVLFGRCTQWQKRAGISGALLLTIALQGGICDNVYAQKFPNGSGNVVLDGSDDYFATDAKIDGTTYPILNFSGDNLSFENKGKIGTAADGTSVDAVDQINAGSIGTFTNSGTVNYRSGITVSELTNIQGGVITNTAAETDGQISITGDLTNRGLIDAGGTLSAANAINSGTIQKFEAITIGTNGSEQPASFDQQQGGTIQDVDTLTVHGDIINSGTMDGLLNVKATNITNSNTIQNIDKTVADTGVLTATNNLINTGKIENVDRIVANTSLSNQNLITDVRGITSDNFHNTGVLNDIVSVTGNLTNNGIIKLDANDKMTINGTFTTESSNSMQVRLDSDGSNDEYIVTGGTTINGGEVVVKLNDEAANYQLGDKYTFLTSGSLDVNQALTVSDQSDPLANRLRYRLSFDDYNYYLSVARAFRYGENAPTYNQKNFGTYIDNISDNVVAGSDLENVLTALDGLSPGEDISPAARYALAQMDGAIYGSMATMEVQNMTIVNNTLTNFLRPKNVFGSNMNEDSYNSGSPIMSQGLKMWGTYYGVDGYAKSDGNAFGGDYSVNGVLVGGDRYITPNFRLGGFFAFGDTEYQVNGLNEQANADSYKAGLYFVHNSENGYLLGNFNYGWDNFNMTRNIDFLERKNTAETSGREWAFRIEKGFNWALEKAILQPFGAFQYLSLNTNAFSEQGIGATALNIDKASYDSYRTEFGGRLLWAFEGQSRTGNLFLQASWMHEYGDTYGTVSSSFKNKNKANYTGNYKYTVNGVDLGSDWCNLGLGGDLTQNNITLFGGYDFMVSGTQNLHTGNIGLAYQF